MKFKRFQTEFKNQHSSCWNSQVPGGFKCVHAAVRDPQAHLCFLNGMADPMKYATLMTTMATLFKLIDTLKQANKEIKEVAAEVVQGLEELDLKED